MRLLLVLFAVAVTGCSVKTVEHPQGPVLIHLSGIQGHTPFDRVFMQRLSDELNATGEQFHWTAADRWMIGALQSEDENRAEAKKLADRITQLRRAEPDRRIILTAHSGGSGFAVFALEQLPADVQIDTLVLMAAAISPSYDLSPALSHVRNSAYAFNSRHDHFYLGWGTRTFGTMDGVREDSAGKVGFARPPVGSPLQYDKLVEIPYQTSWARFSNFGDHFGAISPGFGERVIGPLIATGMLIQ
jgi:pimeloyl-ACP methyl ester carboxylesterase